MSSKKSPALEKRLRHLDHLYGKLQRSLAKVGYVFPGSIVKRLMPCGKPYCRCAADPSRRHGPYYDWTRKLGGKTVTVRLTAEQARLCKGWIGNRRGLKKTLARMQAVSLQVAQAMGAYPKGRKIANRRGGARPSGTE